MSLDKGVGQDATAGNPVYVEYWYMMISVQSKRIPETREREPVNEKWEIERGVREGL